MKSLKSNCIVMRRTNFKEADRIFTFITPENGKIDAVAKGVRKLSSKLAGGLELFCENEIQIIEGKNHNILISARIVEQYTGILNDYERMKTGYLVLEMANVLTDIDTSKDLYSLIKTILKELNRPSIDIASVELYFRLHLLKELGHIPNMNPAQRSHFYKLDFEEGTIVPVGKLTAHALSENELKLWRFMLNNSLDKLSSISNIEEAARNSLVVISDFIHYTFDRQFRAEKL